MKKYKLLSYIGWSISIIIGILGFLIETEIDDIHRDFVFESACAFIMSFLLPPAILLGELFLKKSKEIASKFSKESNNRLSDGNLTTIRQILFFSSVTLVLFGVTNSISSWYRYERILGPEKVISAFGIGLCLGLLICFKKYKSNIAK